MQFTTPIVITTCTQRKSAGASIAIADLTKFGSIAELAQQWRATMKVQATICKSRGLYQGRSIIDAEAAAETLGARMFFVSAGLGIVSADQDVPAYDCTVAPGSALSRKLSADGLNSSHWWKWLTQGEPHPLSHLLHGTSAYVAMSASYIRLVRDDLSQLEASQAQGLRIFTSVAGSKEVPPHLSANVLPYDDRLESLPGFAGTRSDFAQRALRHFVHALGGHHIPLKHAHTTVQAAFASLNLREQPARTRMNDDQIREILVAQWKRHGGSSTRLLRHLRDDALVSCEQGRFSRLWQALDAELRV